MFSYSSNRAVPSHVPCPHRLLVDQRCCPYVLISLRSILHSAQPKKKSQVLLAFFALLFLARRRHRAGDEHMWHAPVTSCAWFNQYNGKEAPLTTKPERKRPSMNQIPSVLPIAAAHTTPPRRQHSRHASSRSNNNATTRAAPPANPSRSNTKSSGIRNNNPGYGSQGRRPKDIAKVYPSAAGRHGRLPSGSAEAPLMGSAMIEGINDGELLDDNPRLERGRRR